MRVRSAAFACAALSLAACKPPTPSAPAADRPAAERPAERAAAPAAPSRSDERCVAPLDAPGAWTTGRQKKGRLVLGVVAGLKEASEDNLAHVKALVAEMRKRGIEAIVADGDLGDTPEEQEALLGVLTQTGLPVLALAGNREARSDLDAAEANLRKRGAVIFDLSHSRPLDLGDALVFGLAGGFDRRHGHSEGSCIYVQRDLDALQAYLSKLPASAPPVLLVAAVPPRGQDARALDASEGQNLGDPRLTTLLQSRRVSFGIFGQVWEAGARAIDTAGAPVEQDKPAEHIFLNPGAAAHTPWPMNDGSTSHGGAAILVIEGRRASYSIVRLPVPGPRAG